MILALAVLLGCLVAVIRYRRDAFRRIAALRLRYAWLIIIALILQIPLLRAPGVPPEHLEAQQALFVSSYGFLLVFIWLNRRSPAVLLAGAGIILNFLVIKLNGGFMPITPQTLVRINPSSQIKDWGTGLHYPGSKDLVLVAEATRLGWLSDVLVLTKPFPFPTAFSVGDVLIAAGITWLLSDLPAGDVQTMKPTKNRIREERL